MFLFRRKSYFVDFPEDKSLLCINKTPSMIDQITWNDLDMDCVLKKINFTVSSPGEDTLRKWLKEPLSCKEDIDKRGFLLNETTVFTKKAETKHSKFIKKLKKLPCAPYKFDETLKEDFIERAGLLFFLRLLVLTTMILFEIILVSFNHYVFSILALLLIVSGIIHYKFEKKYGPQIQMLKLIVSLIIVSKNSLPLIRDIYPVHYKKIKLLCKKLKYISRFHFLFFEMEGINVINDYFNIVTLAKETSFLKLSKRINRHIDEILLLYTLIGELDALQSIVKYRETLNYYSVPIIDDSKDQMSIKDVYHPLIDNSIPNSIELNKSLAITGSNMSGKSTFLRVVSINAILSQSICTSLSSEYKSFCVRVITSISLNDELSKGKSYFMMEAQAIKRMIDIIDDGFPTLIAIDEIFKGTNPVERVAASTEILNLLAKSSKVTVIVATHDMQIIPNLENYKKYYFTEQFTKSQLTFDYKIYSGIAPSRNAVKLLDYIEYPSELIKKIYNRLEATEISDAIAN